jgi:hypothetical protein
MEYADAHVGQAVKSNPGTEQQKSFKQQTANIIVHKIKRFHLKMCLPFLQTACSAHLFFNLASVTKIHTNKGKEY